MDDQKIKVLVEGRQMLEVVVSSMKPEAIWIFLGEGPHSMRCKLTPTRNSLAYAGSVMGREIVYERSVRQVREDLAGQQHDSFQHRTR